MSKSLRWVLEPRPIHPYLRARLMAARSLRRLAVGIASLSRCLRRPASAADPESLSFEFHAEAGAPEGALYVNGERVGSIIGVTRL